ncbi:MAG: hypothetical protein J7L31_04100 [Thermoplasmata archaeon]|nr:hypothetical protein [Thermoplasmata archaeon]
MQKKLAVMIVAMLMLLPIASVNDIRIKKGDVVHDAEESHSSILRNARWSSWHDYMQGGFFIHTVYNGIEKDTPVLQSIFSGIDVDNNPDTGVNGNDIKVSIIPLPLLQSTDVGMVLSISLALKVIRLGDEIKNGEFEISFGGVIMGEHNFRIGYYSAENEEIPKEVREVVTVVPYLFYDHDPEFYINMEPVFEGGVENVSAILEYSNAAVGEHRVMIDYFPAQNTMIKVTPHIELSRFGISIERNAPQEETLRLRYEMNGNAFVNLTIEDIPERMAFTVGFSENYFEYDADDEFNVTMIIGSNMGFITRIEYLPRHLAVSFNQNGYLDINVDERKTKFIVANALVDPTLSFSVTNLSGECIVRWSMESIGYLTIDGFAGVKAEIKAEMENAYFDYYAEIKAEHFELNWSMSIPGYISMDTNWEWLASYHFNYTYQDTFGVVIESSMMRARDYTVGWQSSFPFFSIDGDIEFMGDFVFKIMLDGTWYNVIS